MEEYREAQKQKWLQARDKQNQEQAPGSAPSGSSAAASSSGAGNTGLAATSAAASVAAASSSHGGDGGAAAVSSNAASSSGAAEQAANSDAERLPGQMPNARRVHILPVGRSPDNHGTGRLDLIAPALREKRSTKAALKTGTMLHCSGEDFIVAKADPEGSLLSPDTDYFVEGDPVVRFEKVHFICLWDFESGNVSQDSSILFSSYINPFFRSFQDSGEDAANLVFIGQIMKIFDLEFQVMAAEPSPPDMGIIDANTMIYVDWDSTPEFDKIHIVPFQDTLPHAYEFDVFNDYLKPYLTKYKHMRFGVNDQFTYQGVQFKVVCCEPDGPARIGRNTTIYCEGVLHPSLRNLLPPELLEQLSHLPPGLQMLLLNTEALAGGYEERLIEVQEMLSRRRGLSNETIDQVSKFRWEDAGRDSSQMQCMVCLSNFANGEEVRKLPCGHIFHAPCIDEWLRRCTDCPICKANVDRAVRHY